MPNLSGYNAFGGRHWETGSVHNFFAYRDFTAPHTSEAYSEALLLGVSGGIVVGYFNFAYEGYDPQCNILTRNTFDPMDTMLSRLGVVQYSEQTRKPERAVRILTDTLEEGVPAIVWADRWSLPYNGLSDDAGMWGAFPIIVYGYDETEEAVFIADRASVPLKISTDELAAARGRIKKDRYRLLTLDAPVEEKLVSAVQLGICDTIKLFTEKPPKGSKNSFGLAALRFWAKMLTQPRQRKSWEKIFPPGPSMYAGLMSAFDFAFLFGKGMALDAERGMYADFLDEAAVLLERPALREAAARFRVGAEAWRALPDALLSDEVAPFAEARALMQRRHLAFLEEGAAALVEMQRIDGRLDEIRTEMAYDFPLDAGEVQAYRERLAGKILAIHDAEAKAVEALNESMV